MFRCPFDLYKKFRLDAGGNIKVADFGLSEDVYTTGYFKQGRDDNVKLPFKWMAPESMTDGIFNEKTDVVRMHALKCHCSLLWIYLCG